MLRAFLSREIARADGALCGLVLLAGQVIAADYETEFSALTQGLPKEIRDFIDRRANCNHWYGEYPYDEERKEQIAAALMVLQCDRLRKDERLLHRRYIRNDTAIKALEVSKDWSPG
jgi:hypothetical protein